MSDAAKRILIVDDEPGLLQILKLCLAVNGWEVVAVTNGAAALAVFEVGRFQALLADVDLQDGMGGIEVARRLLEQEPPLRVVMMSGEPDNAAKVREAKLERFVAKPFEMPALCAQLHGDS